MTPFAEAEELVDNPLCSPKEGPHAALQLLVATLKAGIQRPQVLDRGRVQKEVLWQPRQERLEFI